MKQRLIATIKCASLVTMFAGSAMLSAETLKSGEAKPFDCIDKTTFEMKSECLSSNIENNFAFKQAENKVFEQASEASDRALATMTFDNRNMTIKIVAHTDATIAKADTKKK